MKKNKKMRLTIQISTIVVVLVAIVLFVFNFSYNKYSFSLVEERWIKDNKNKLIDIKVINDTPLFGEFGKGIYFDFIDYITEESGLKFNIIPIKSGDNIEEEGLTLLSKEKDKGNNLTFYDDSYVLVGKIKKDYDGIEELNNLTIGVLKSDFDLISYYVDNSSIVYKEYDNNDDLLIAYNENEVDNVIISKSNNYEFILDNNNYVNYNFYEINNKYSFNIDTSDVNLNSIMNKFYNRFMDNEYEKIYNEYYNELYIKVNSIDSAGKSNLTSKTYVLGFVESKPYINYSDETYDGYIVNYLNNYSKITGVDFEYKKYETKEELIKAIIDNKVDIVFNDISGLSFSTNYYSVMSNYKENYLLLSTRDNKLYVNSIKSLKDKKILVEKDSILNEYLINNSTVEIDNFINIDDLKNKLNDNSIIALDKQVYEYYKDSILKNYIPKYEDSVTYEYGFMINEKEENNLFIPSFEKYISLSNYNKVIYEEYTLSESEFDIVIFIQLALVIVLVVLTVLFILQLFVRKHKEKVQTRKENKLKYIDLLTSLKNRTYLTDNIDKWDNTNIYPQAVVMIDLNKIKYVNDTSGSIEGDRIIKKCANLLIKNQLQNTDIIRTDGNEFMIYMVGYSETQVIAYCRKLYKELKDLPHGYGGSIGHSMITDDIKTIEDATNEAMIIVRESKQK